MTKRPEPNRHVMLNSFQHLVCFFLLSAAAPFIPVHRTGFSGAILIKASDSRSGQLLHLQVKQILSKTIFLFLSLKDISPYPLDTLTIRPYHIFDICTKEFIVTGSILIVSSLDTKGQEVNFLKTLIEQRGHKTLLLDMSMRGEPQIPADVPCE